MRELTGDAMESESVSLLRFGTVVREELSDENKLDPRVAVDTEDLILAWSKERRWPVDESVVEKESYVA